MTVHLIWKQTLTQFLSLFIAVLNTSCIVTSCCMMIYSLCTWLYLLDQAVKLWSFCSFTNLSQVIKSCSHPGQIISCDNQSYLSFIWRTQPAGWSHDWWTIFCFYFMSNSDDHYTTVVKGHPVFWWFKLTSVFPEEVKTAFSTLQCLVVIKNCDMLWLTFISWSCYKLVLDSLFQ